MWSKNSAIRFSEIYFTLFRVIFHIQVDVDKEKQKKKKKEEENRE